LIQALADISRKQDSKEKTARVLNSGVVQDGKGRQNPSTPLIIVSIEEERDNPSTELNHRRPL
jgi:hypothetical protein